MRQDGGSFLERLRGWLANKAQNAPQSAVPNVPAFMPTTFEMERQDALAFAREAPLGYGPWRQFKWLYKHAEEQNDAELLGALIGRLDAAAFPAGQNHVPEMPTLNSVFDAEIAGQYLYLLTGEQYGRRALRIVDVSDPLHPKKVGEVAITSAEKVVVRGDSAYVLASSQSYNQKGHLHVIDISDPKKPIKGRSLELTNPKDLILSGPYAYILRQEYYYPRTPAQMSVIDISDPTRPVEAGSLSVNEPHTIAIAGADAYVISRQNYADRAQLHAIDLSNPTKPSLLGNCNIRNACAVALRGNLAYVAAGTHYYTSYNRNQRMGLHIVDIANPTKLHTVHTVELGNAHGVAVQGNFAYVAVENYGSYHDKNFQTGGLRVLDLSDPRKPVQIGSLDGLNVQEVRVDGLRAYIGVKTGFGAGVALRSVDISDPTKPILLGASPSRATLGYMKRRARRFLHETAKSDPNLYIETVFHALMQAGKGRTEVDPATQWVSIDALYGGSDRYVQSGHGRGGYIEKNRRLSLRRREERLPELWDSRPDFARTLYTASDQPWQTQVSALKMLRAAKAELPKLSEAVLSRFVGSPSPLLITTATREVVARLEAGGKIPPALAADTYLLSGGRLRRRLTDALEKRGDLGKWGEDFANRLLTLVSANLVAGRMSRRQAGAALLLAQKFPNALTAQVTPDFAIALFSTGHEALRQLALGVIRGVSPAKAQEWLVAIERFPADRRDEALNALIEGQKEKELDMVQASSLVRAETEWVCQAGWRLLAGSATSAQVLATVWEALLDLPDDALSLQAALNSPIALELLNRVPLDSERLLARLQARPMLVRLLPPAAFEAVVKTVPVAAVLQLIDAAPDAQWLGLREACLQGLTEAGKMTAFWQAAFAAINDGTYQSIQSRLLDDPMMRDSFLPVEDESFLLNANPAFGPLLFHWASAREAQMGKDSPLLLLLATHPLPELRDWALGRVRAFGMSLPFALRLLESALPPSVAAGKAFFEAVPAGDARELEYALALSDSPQPPVRAYGNEYVAQRWTTLPTEELLSRLAENPDPNTQAFLARQLLATPERPANTAEFDRDVLRARDRGRRAKEIVKKRLTRETSHDVAMLLEMARSRTPRDAEWALQQLAQLALEGQEIEGFSVEGVAGV